MPAIFYSDNSEWHAERLGATHGVLRFAPVRIEAHDLSTIHFDFDSAAVVLLRIGSGRDWAALVPGDFPLTHNGQPVPAGLRVLAHGDLLAHAGSRAFFSTEESACVEVFTGSEAIACPRCKLPIAPGQSVVRCPDCGVVHHQLVDRPCWNYAPNCSFCPRSTALDAGLRWSPESL